MTEGQRHLFSKEITSSAMGMQGAAMKKELKELRAKYPDHKAFASIELDQGLPIGPAYVRRQTSESGGFFWA